MDNERRKVGGNHGGWVLAALLAAAAIHAEPGGERPLESIARTQLAAGEYETAARIAEREVKTLEQTESRYFVGLATPLTILGDARLALDDTDGAVDAYVRARHVLRVNEGLNTPSQIPVLYREARAYVKAGDVVAANHAQEHAYQVNVTVFGDSAELIDGQIRLARWYDRSGHYLVARWMYRDALGLVDRHTPGDDGTRLELLRRVAATYRRQTFPPYKSGRAPYMPRPGGRPWTTMPGMQKYVTSNPKDGYSRGRRAHESVVEFAREHRADDPAVIGGALLRLGDWHLLFSQFRRATEAYAEAQVQLAAAGPELFTAAFAEPKLLYLPFPGNPSTPPDSWGATPRDGSVELSLAVSERGTPQNVEATRTVPEDVVTIRYVRATRLARYRPAFRDGHPVKTRDVTVVHTFKYAAVD